MDGENSRRFTDDFRPPQVPRREREHKESEAMKIKRLAREEYEAAMERKKALTLD